MEVFSNIVLNLQAPAFATVYSPQGQTLSRSIQATLMDGATPWEIPSTALCIIRYAKPDGTKGFYDTLEDDSSAYSYNGNVVTFGLATQALTVPGTVLMQLDFYNSDGEKLSTFTFRLIVGEGVFADSDITSSDYFNVLTGKLTEAAEIFQQIKAAYGAPLTANTAADMTDTSRVYVYTGTTGGGFTNGHWYYWDGTAWADGGNYNSTGFTTDTSLSIAGAAADAKATGDAVGDLNRQISDTQEIIYDSPRTVSSFISGIRLPASPSTVTPNAARATTAELFYVHAGDIVSITGNKSTQQYALNGLDGYASGWKNGIQTFTIDTTGEYYVNVASVGGVALDIATVEHVITITDKTSRLAVLEDKNIQISKLPVSRFGAAYSGYGGQFQYITGVSGTAADGTTTFPTGAVLWRVSTNMVLNMRPGIVQTGAYTKTYASMDEVCAEIGDAHYTIVNDLKYVILNGNQVLCFDIASKNLVVKLYTDDLSNYINLIEQRSTQLVGGVLLCKTITDGIKTDIEEKNAATVEQIETISDKTLITLDTLNANVPAHIKPGDSYTIYTADGTKFTPTGFYFYDANLEYITFNSLASQNTNKRTLTYTGTRDAFFVQIRGGTAQTVYVDLDTSVRTDAYTAVAQQIVSEKSLYVPSISKKYNTVKTEHVRDLVKHNSVFNFLFFSDIHGQHTNMERIVELSKAWGTTYVDAIINGGDSVNKYLNDPSTTDPYTDFTWYQNAITASDIDILSCIGNHDAWSGAYWQNATPVETYNAIIAPIVAKYTGIVQPASADTDGLCYFYKDYGNIRVIVLDASNRAGFWNQTEGAWLTSVLEAARTAGKSVIIVNHPPFASDIVERNEGLNWNSYLNYVASSDGIFVHTEALDIVQAFISAGGEFICWLTGHTHHDNVITAAGYSGQFMLNTASARSQYHTDGLTTNNVEDDLYDCFNYVGIDTTHKIIKCARIGWNQDAALKTRTFFSYDYGTKIVMQDI